MTPLLQEIVQEFKSATAEARRALQAVLTERERLASRKRELVATQERLRSLRAKAVAQGQEPPAAWTKCTRDLAEVIEILDDVLPSEILRLESELGDRTRAAQRRLKTRLQEFDVVRRGALADIIRQLQVEHFAYADFVGVVVAEFGPSNSVCEDFRRPTVIDQLAEWEARLVTAQPTTPNRLVAVRKIRKLAEVAHVEVKLPDRLPLHVLQRFERTYALGEICGFEEAVADSLIKYGVAEEWKPARDEPPEPDPDIDGAAAVAEWRSRTLRDASAWRAAHGTLLPGEKPIPSAEELAR